MKKLVSKSILICGLWVCLSSFTPNSIDGIAEAPGYRSEKMLCYDDDCNYVATGTRCKPGGTACRENFCPHTSAGQW